VRGERYVVLGLSHVRSAWFSEVSRWSTGASLPIEFVKCVSIEEVRARLASGRAFSALLVDANLPGVDRDLVDSSRAGGCAALVVDDGTRATRDWLALGASAVLPGVFGREDLLDALATSARPIGRGDAREAEDDSRIPTSAWRGRLVAVAGVAGAGTSTVAMALAQGFGADSRNAGLVLLADLALHADQAMLHDAGDVVPSVQELVDAHRSGQPSVPEMRSLTYSFPERQYHLLLGLRRHRDWATIRPRAFEAALDGVRRCYKIVVADVTGDFEGEDECGSIDVEERNLMARTVVGAADAVVLVGNPGLRGLHRLVQLVGSTLDRGVDVRRIVPVINHAPRHPRGRAEITRALAALTAGLTAGQALAPPVQLAERRRLDEVVHDGARLPVALVGPLTGAVAAAVERGQLAPAVGRTAAPVAVVPGSLGITDT
jgi:hypothetical protein